MTEQIAIKNEVEEIIGHSGGDPVTRVSVKLEWREEEGLWHQSFQFAGDGDKWQNRAAISTDLAYNTLLKHFGLFEHKSKLNFGEISHFSREQLKQMQITRYPRLGQIEIFPLAINEYLGESVKFEFARCEKRSCPSCQKIFEACWMGCASTNLPHLIQICPHCGLQHKAVI